MTKEQTKEEIKHLINRYELQKSRHLLDNYNEAMTRKDFILPLFRALGWDVHNEFNQEFIEEERAIQGRIDYVCQIDNSPKLYLEIKAMKVDLEKEEWAKQVISYAYHKGIAWAVLSDFEGIKVFNAEWEVATPEQCKLFEFKSEEYLENFEKIWLLSREESEKGSLDKIADENYKKPKRKPINELLAKDLLKWHDELKTAFTAKNTISEQTLEEAIQRFLDRLIFIRTIEDRQIEQKYLWQSLQEWLAKDRKSGLLIDRIHKLFQDYDDWYNSKLFKPHVCDSLNLELAESYFEDIINDLYREKGISRIPYTFDKINADTLGNIYEQYLGAIQKGETQDTTRKKHGIYYTPTYIVEYIVNNTLGNLLKEKSIREIQGLKILDPACGSGSFLIKSFELINNHLRAEQGESNANKTFHHIRKFRILNENIFGVDLDPKATEIARLNLLLKTVEFREKLPMLTNNIKEGNSLIHGSEKELKKYFEKDWENKKSFSWKEQFPEVLQNNGFDIIIGNPPWGAELTKQDKRYFKDYYTTSSNLIDTFALFIESSLVLLRDKGYLGFILPDIVLLKNYPATRKLILDNFIIKNAVHSGMIFKGVNLDSVILILQKENNPKIRTNNNVVVIKNINNFQEHSWEQTNIRQNLFEKNDKYKFNLYLTRDNIEIKEKINRNSIPLNEIGEVHEGIHSGNLRSKIFTNEPTSGKSKKLIFKGDEVNTFFVQWRGKYVNYDPALVNKKLGEYANFAKKEYFEEPKILIRRTGDKIIAALDNEKYFASNNLFIFQNTKNNNYNLKFILAILNSNLTTWYFNTIQPRKGKLFAEVKIEHINQFPIYNINFNKKHLKSIYDEIIFNSDRINKLQIELAQFDGLETDDSEKIEENIKTTLDSLNQKVYELYGLNKKEIEIIEKGAN